MADSSVTYYPVPYTLRNKDLSQVSVEEIIISKCTRKPERISRRVTNNVRSLKLPYHSTIFKNMMYRAHIIESTYEPSDDHISQVLSGQICLVEYASSRNSSSVSREVWYVQENFSLVYRRHGSVSVSWRTTKINTHWDWLASLTDQRPRLSSESFTIFINTADRPSQTEVTSGISKFRLENL